MTTRAMAISSQATLIGDRDKEFKKLSSHITPKIKLDGNDIDRTIFLKFMNKVKNIFISRVERDVLKSGMLPTS